MNMEALHFALKAQSILRVNLSPSHPNAILCNKLVESILNSD